MRRAVILFAVSAATLCAQQGQTGAPPGWPCVPGRAVDPAYLEISESTGGQLFLFQKGEVAHASLVMGAPYTHPATVLRAVGQLSGTREFEFPVDSKTGSILVMASLQCRTAIGVFRPNGAELTAANSAQSVELQAGRILQVDLPETGKWKLRLAGTGLFVVSVAAKTDLTLGGVSLGHQGLQLRLGGEVSDVRVQVDGPAGDRISELGAAEPAEGGVYRIPMTPPAGRFRIVVTGTDSMAAPFRRTWPNLMDAKRSQ